MRRALLGVAAVATAAAGLYLGCDDEQNVSVYDPNADSGTPDSGAVGRGVGEACSSDSQCRSGLRCDDETGTCQPGHAKEAGDACVISAECLDGLYCGDGICVAAGDGEEGADCVTDADCASGYRCVLLGFKAECVAEGSVDYGGECGTSGDCFGGLGCVEGVCTIMDPGVPPFGEQWAGVDCPEVVETGVEALFHVPRASDTDSTFFTLPWPNDVRLDGGQIDLSGFPTPGAALHGFDVVQRWVDAVEDSTDGWGVYNPVIFRFSGQINHDTFADNLEVVNLTTDSELGYSYSYTSGRSNYICHNRVAIGRSRGRTWEAGATYAIYFTTGVKTHLGTDIVRPTDLIALLDDAVPSDPELAVHHPKYAPLRDYLTAHAIDKDTILNASVFTVGNPQAALEQLQGVIDSGSPPAAAEWTRCDTGVTSPCPQADGERACPAADPGFHELHALVSLPIYQLGTAPYLEPDDGGDLNLGAGGIPEAVRTEDVCLSLTVPAGPAPAGGWPTVVFAHSTGGHFRSHVASGVAAAFAAGVDDGQSNVVQAAVLGIDQVQHGPRRGAAIAPPPHDLYFNLTNPKAQRGNPQQAAADQLALLRFVPTVSFDATSSPTGEAFALSDVVAFWGHSQGATAGALALPYGDWAAAVFAGQSASLKDLLITKTSPTSTAGVVPFALSDFTSDGKLPHGIHHPVLMLMQLHHDGADPVAYARLAIQAPPPGATAHSLFQIYGQLDTYTPADVQATYALGASLEQVTADSSVASPDEIGSLSALPAPLSGNFTVDTVTVTGGVRQYAPFTGMNGHFVAYDVPSATADALRFLAGALGGALPQIGE